MPRRRALELSTEQQHVLDLMAKGRTNFEIAQDLGVSLSGAKYQVTQVFDKLGVDSRDDAVAAWRQSHGVLARLRALLWPAAALAGGGVVAVAVVAGVVGLAGGGSNKAAGAGRTQPGVWVTMIKPTNARQPGEGAEGPLEVFRAGDQAGEHTIMGTYESSPSAGPEWSPDGRHIAVAGRTPGTGIHSPLVFWIFTRTGSAWTSTSIPGASPGMAFAWAPDSSGIASVGWTKAQHAQVTFISPSGKQLAAADVPSRGSSPKISFDDSPVWSPDGHTAAWRVNGSVVVVGPNSGKAYEIPIGAGGAAYWVDRNHVYVDGTLDELDTTTGKWSTLTSPAPPLPSATLPPTLSANVLATLGQPAPITEGTTADGSGWVYGPDYLDPIFPKNGYRIAIAADKGSISTANLGAISTQQYQLRNGYDVVIVQ